MDSEAIRATTKNVISVGATKGVSALVNLGGSVLLTRLLMPADYGVFALSVFFFSFVVQFLDIGLDPALLAYQGDLRKAGGTHFMSKVALACVGFLMVMAALPLDCLRIFNFLNIMRAMAVPTHCGFINPFVK